jgi:Bacterial Ig domain
VVRESSEGGAPGEKQGAVAGGGGVGLTALAAAHRPPWKGLASEGRETRLALRARAAASYRLAPGRDRPANDTDVDGDGPSVSSVGQAAHGTATKNANGTIKYQPNADYNGEDSFTYTVSDGRGGTNQGTVNITVTAVNDDTNAPSTQAALDPANPNGQNGWYTGALHLTLSADDGSSGSGVAETRCVLDPASPPASLDALLSSPLFTRVRGRGSSPKYRCSSPQTGAPGPDSRLLHVPVRGIQGDTSTGVSLASCGLMCRRRVGLTAAWILQPRSGFEPVRRI